MTKMKGTVLVCDEPTVTGRIYPREVVKMAVDEYNNKKQKFVFVVDGDGWCKVENIVGKVESLEMDEGMVVVNYSFLPSEQAKCVGEMITKGTLRFCPIGYGEVDGGVVSKYSIQSVCIKKVD